VLCDQGFLSKVYFSAKVERQQQTAAWQARKMAIVVVGVASYWQREMVDFVSRLAPGWHCIRLHLLLHQPRVE
jgi:hypothetical protein